MNRPLVSVIIPTKNSQTTIRRCIQSIRDQSYPNIELIVVDNYSLDATREIAVKYGARIFLDRNERASQVNHGVNNAHGKYVYRVDSDFLLDPHVVDEAVSKCEDHAYDAVTIHNTSDPSVSFWSKVRKLERDCYKSDELNVGARFLKREVFEAVGGFDETLVAAEDYDLHNRLLAGKFKVGRINAQEIHIGEPKTLAEIVRKNFYYGKTIQKYIGKNPARATRQLNPAKLSYFRHISVFLKSPQLLLGFGVYQFTKYVSALIGLVTIKLRLTEASTGCPENRP